MARGITGLVFGGHTLGDGDYSFVISIAQRASLRVVDGTGAALQQDCGTENNLEMRAIVQGGAVIASLGERILGRTAAVVAVHLYGQVCDPGGLDAFAEKRLTNSCRSEIWALAFAFADSTRWRACTVIAPSTRSEAIRRRLGSGPWTLTWIGCR